MSQSAHRRAVLLFTAAVITAALLAPAAGAPPTTGVCGPHNLVGKDNKLASESYRHY